MNLKNKLKSAIEEKIRQISFLEIKDVSYKHAGHIAVKDSINTETHFEITLISPIFADLKPIERHKIANQAISHLFQNTSLHSVSFTLKSD